MRARSYTGSLQLPQWSECNYRKFHHQAARFRCWYQGPDVLPGCTPHLFSRLYTLGPWLHLSCGPNCSFCQFPFQCKCARGCVPSRLFLQGPDLKWLVLGPHLVKRIVISVIIAGAVSPTMLHTWLTMPWGVFLFVCFFPFVVHGDVHLVLKPSYVSSVFVSPHVLSTIGCMVGAEEDVLKQELMLS